MQEMQGLRVDPWVRKIPWRRKWRPTPVFLPGKSHGQRILVGYSPWGHTELDMTDLTHTHSDKVSPESEINVLLKIT